MEYMLLIYDDEKAWASLPDDERAAIVADYFALSAELRDRGAYVAGAPLHPTTSASSVRVRDGEEVVTDGPFAETREQLGGYYLIRADSVDEARRWAAKVPAARYGTVEVRPVLAAESPAAA